MEYYILVATNQDGLLFKLLTFWGVLLTVLYGSCCNMSIIKQTELLLRKLFKGGNYMRKSGIQYMNN